ncbi:Disease resistance protein RPM1 [Dichanthelium oligosanthes]|uniref:Disease resistance protein RPM1 n=1 Tax=Dichanthelium oligosanthes TaxID=888268 RepID=A0A1E5UZG3_9POAL|nr:Disease resistance protein RPM1 [Dichanthelium oligosanthes]
MEGAAQILVSNLAQLVGEEFRQLRGVGGEVARLRNELATINALLRMQSEADEGAVDHFVREWMKQLREVAYDAEDCVDLYLFRVRCPSGDRSFVWCKRLLTTLMSRRRLASDIRALRALASAVNEQHARYGVSLEPLRRTAASDPVAVAASARALRPADNDPDHQFVGSKAQAIALANKVKALNHENDKQRKVFSIVGFGGLGKTTLAVEVCRQLETEFQRQAQVSVSQTFSAKDLQGLLKRVLRQIAQHQAGSLGNIDAMNVDDLEVELKERLENYRYLILIDDVWSIAAWDTIRSKLPSSNCGSRVIVTTRIDTVAKACSDANDDCIHHMKKLDEADSEQLFVSKAFGSGKSCPSDLKDIMRSILKKCAGLPLAIVNIASLLASYRPPEGKKIWETVQKSIGSQMETNPTLEGMRQILTLSYNHLPHHLKACAMYLSIFPEDYMIVKDRLLKRWIAEGLIAEKRGLTQMELAEGYFNELMSRSMIDHASNQVTLREGREEGCRVHDMMLEILVSKSLEANFVSLVGGQYEGMSCANTIRRLSIHGGVEAHKDSSSNIMAARRGTGNGIIRGMVVQHVRSLTMFDPEEAHKLLARLGEFTLIRVLDLEDCKGLGKKHMSCICRMYLLRFLSLKGTDIKVMPRTVGDLEHLQTLDVRQTHLKHLPETVKKLEKLEHLLFSGKGETWSGWMLPQGINKMKALRQVNKAAVVYDPKVAKEIGELDQLQELAIYVDTRKEMKQEVVKELARSLSKMYTLRWLDIGNFGCDQWPFNQIMDFLHGVESPPRLLRYLKICGRIDRMPDWLELLTDLVEFDIGWTYLDGVQLFNVLCKLPNLKRLYLGPYFIRKGENMVARSCQSFPELKELTLGYSPEVPPVYIFEEGSMEKLEMLAVYFGDQPKEVVGIENLTNLKEVQFNGWRDKLKRGLEQLEELNNKRDVSEQIAVRVRYEDR